MSGNAQKTPFAVALNRFAEKKVNDAIQLQGKALPASVIAVSGSIVTVAFEIQSQFTLPQVTIPVGMPEYIRLPLQPGDKGIVVPSAVRLGGITGLGSGLPGLTIPANLSALVFFPVGNANWPQSADPQSVVLYGPNGVILKSQNGIGSLQVMSTGVNINGTLTVNGVIVTVP